MQVIPARANERTIAGPARPIASPMMTKIPVPMIAPIPSAVRSSAPTERWSPVWSSASGTSWSVGLRANVPGLGAASGHCRAFFFFPRRSNSAFGFLKPETSPDPRGYRSMAVPAVPRYCLNDFRL